MTKNKYSSLPEIETDYKEKKHKNKKEKYYKSKTK